MHLSKGSVRVRVEDPTVGEQACESAEHEDVRTFWVSLGSGGRMEALGPQQFLKEFDIGSKERTAMELKTLVRCLLLSGGHDHLNAANLYCLEEVARRVCQLVEAYESGAHGKPNWNSVKWFTSVHSSSTMVPVSIRSFAFTKAKEEVEAENLRLRATTAFDDGDRETSRCSLSLSCNDETRRKGKRKERAAAADSCCGRIMSAKQASAVCPSDLGSTGLKWAAEEQQHRVPLFNTVPRTRREWQFGELLHCRAGVSP